MYFKVLWFIKQSFFILKPLYQSYLHCYCINSEIYYIQKCFIVLFYFLPQKMNTPSILNWKSFGKRFFNRQRFISPKISGLEPHLKCPWYYILILQKIHLWLLMVVSILFLSLQVSRKEKHDIKNLAKQNHSITEYFKGYYTTFPTAAIW